jgi:hypothetical protein
LLAYFGDSFVHLPGSKDGVEGSREGEREREDAILVIEKNKSMDFSWHLSVSVFMLFALFSFFPINAVARGGDRISSQPGAMNHSKGFSTRRLFGVKEHPLTEEIVRGYMSNSDLEKSIKEFGKRCANISYVYRRERARISTVGD